MITSDNLVSIVIRSSKSTLLSNATTTANMLMHAQRCQRHTSVIPNTCTATVHHTKISFINLVLSINACAILGIFLSFIKKHALCSLSLSPFVLYDEYLQQQLLNLPPGILPCDLESPASTCRAFQGHTNLALWFLSAGMCSMVDVVTKAAFVVISFSSLVLMFAPFSCFYS